MSKALWEVPSPSDQGDLWHPADSLDQWKAQAHARPTHPSTSHEAAAALKPTVKGKMAEALRVLKAHGPATAAELEASQGVSDGRLRKRLTDLRTPRLARVTGKRKCKVTGRTAQIWEAV